MNAEDRLALLARNLLLATAYVILGKLGLKLAFVHVSATAVWAPTGIALAAFLLYGRRVWAGIFAGAFLVNLMTTGGVGVSAGIAAGNTLEGLAGAYLVDLFAGGHEALSRSGGILRFAVLAGLLSTMVSATIGVSTLFLANLAKAAALKEIWLTWWLGDASGALIVAPALLLWSTGPVERYSRGKLLELGGLALALVLVGRLVFGGLLPTAANDYPFDFLCLPVLIWAAFRFGQRETALASCALSGLAIWGTLSGFGPFTRQSQNESLLLLQAFMAATAIVALIVAAVVAERRAAETALRGAHGDLEARVLARTSELSWAVGALKKEILERQRAEEALQRSNTELNLFASVAAHELQEPLRKLLTFGNLVKTLHPADKEEDGYLQRMQESALRMSRLIEDILNLSRVITNAKPLERVNLGEVLAEIQADFADRLTQAGSELTVEPLPALRADASQLRQLFGNLVSNAYKFRDQERPLRIAVSSRSLPEGFVEVKVEDNGIGFDERYLSRIFKPFQRLHRRTEYEGSGMGLALCGRIALRHGGVVTASSKPGQGSTFVVTLPS
jgi:signal transduction histidine kinase